MVFIRRHASGRMSSSFSFSNDISGLRHSCPLPLSINSISPLQNFGITYSIVLSWNSVAGPGLPQPRSCQPPESRRVHFLCRYFVTCARHWRTWKWKFWSRFPINFTFCTRNSNKDKGRFTRRFTLKNDESPYWRRQSTWKYKTPFFAIWKNRILIQLKFVPCEIFQVFSGSLIILLGSPFQAG